MANISKYLKDFIATLSTVATSGSYNDLSNKPIVASYFVGQMIHGQLANTDFTGWLKWTDGRQLSKTTYSELWSWASTNSLVGPVGTNGKFFEDTNGTTFTLHGLSGRSIMASGSGSGLTSRALGAKIGTEQESLTEAQGAVHKHGISNGGYAGNANGVAFSNAVTASYTANNQTAIANSAGGSPHNNIHPSVVLNTFIYSGV